MGSTSSDALERRSRCEGGDSHLVVRPATKDGAAGVLVEQSAFLALVYTAEAGREPVAMGALYELGIVGLRVL
jgi:hypothetical protein